MVLPPPIVIVDQGPDVPAVIREGVLDGCAQGLGPGSCREATEKSANGQKSAHRQTTKAVDAYEPPRFVARLRWEADYRSVTIVVTLEGVEQQRTIAFQPQDPTETRGVVAGLVTATAVAAHRSDSSDSSDKTSQRSDDETQTRGDGPPAIAAAPHHSLRGELGLLTTSAVSTGTLGWGGFGRVSLVDHWGPVFPIAGASYSRARGTIRTQVLRGWLGLGVDVQLGQSSVSLEPSIAVSGESVFLSATDAGMAERDQRWRGGALLGLDLIWQSSPQIHWLVGTQGAMAWPRITIFQSGRAEGNIQVFGWTGLVGVGASL